MNYFAKSCIKKTIGYESVNSTDEGYVLEKCMQRDFFREYTGVTRFEVLPGTTPLVAMALIDMAVSIVCGGKG